MSDATAASGAGKIERRCFGNIELAAALTAGHFKTVEVAADTGGRRRKGSVRWRARCREGRWELQLFGLYIRRRQKKRRRDKEVLVH